MINQISQQFTVDQLIESIGNLPELEIMVNALDRVTVGEVYKSMFPRGLMHTVKEKILKPNSLITSPLYTNFNYKIPKGIANPIENNDNGKKTIQVAANVFDDILDDVSSAKEEPITDDYMYNQPDEDQLDKKIQNVATVDIENNPLIEDESDSRTTKYPIVVSATNTNPVQINTGIPNSIDSSQIRDWFQKYILG